MIQTKVPGKLYIIGEYSVLKPGNNAILVAIDRFIHVKIDAAVDYQFQSEMGRFKWIMDERIPVLNYDEFTHAKAAVYVAHQYLKHKKVLPYIYHINLESELQDKSSQKYGLGSSGAVIIAVIKAILMYHNVEVTPMLLFKLAVLAQIEINDLTSGGEIAASIYGGWVYYQRYDLLWLMNHKGKFEDLLTIDWPLLRIERLKPQNIHVLCCYSGLTQSTKKYIDIVITKGLNQPWYFTFLSKTHLIVNQFKEALLRDDFITIKQMIKHYREALAELEVQTEIMIESEPFKKMIRAAEDLGVAAKTSGAGYGDCGIALTNDVTVIPKLENAWVNLNLEPLKLHVWENLDE